MKRNQGLRGIGISAIFISVAWVGFMFAPIPAYKTFTGETITRTVRLLPPSEWGMSEECICGKMGGTHCTKFAFIERCVTTSYP